MGLSFGRKLKKKATTMVFSDSDCQRARSCRLLRRHPSGHERGAIDNQNAVRAMRDLQVGTPLRAAYGSDPDGGVIFLRNSFSTG